MGWLWVAGIGNQSRLGPEDSASNSLILLTAKLRFPKLSRNKTKPVVLSFSFLLQSVSWAVWADLSLNSLYPCCACMAVSLPCLPTLDLTWGCALSVNVYGAELRELP